MSPAPTNTRLPGGAVVVTLMVDVPVFPPAEADTVVVPKVTPVTSPVWDTVAMPLLELLHVNDVAVAGDVDAVNWTLAPTATDALDGATWTDLIFEPPCCLAAEIVRPPALDGELAGSVHMLAATTAEDSASVATIVVTRISILRLAIHIQLTRQW